LEEQLVERQRACQTAAEGTQHFVGRVSLAVDAPRRELGESFACRNPEERGDRGRQHRQAEQRLLAARRRVAQAEHDEQIRRADQTDESGERDAVHEEAVDAHRELVGCTDRERERYEQRGSGGDRRDRLRPRHEDVEHPGTE